MVAAPPVAVVPPLPLFPPEPVVPPELATPPVWLLPPEAVEEPPVALEEPPVAEPPLAEPPLEDDFPPVPPPDGDVVLEQASASEPRQRIQRLTGLKNWLRMMSSLTEEVFCGPGAHAGL